MACNLLERYGVVPQAVYPESYSSSASGRINRLITSSIRQHSLGLRKLSAQLTASFAAAGLDKEACALAVRTALRKKKEHCLGDTWRILTATLGLPPNPKQKFTWDYYDADGKVHSWTGTPRQFYLEHSSKKYPPTESFSLINDPRNPYSALYTVDKLGNVWGGREVRYVNTSTDRLKAAVVKIIQAGQPVFFGCDVGQLSDTASGVMDTRLFDYQEAFGIALTMDKTARLQSGDSAMTHAMVITGVHLDADGNPVRYRVENSWGDAVGDKGYFVMTDRWFDEFVYQVVVPKALAPKDLVEVYEGSNPTVYPPWDPMGTLA
jgi:bleomycin hydrolase